METENTQIKIDNIDKEIIKLLAERVQILDETDGSDKKILPIDELRERKQKIMALASEYPEEMRDYIPVVVNLLNEMKGTKTRTSGPKGTLAGKIERAKAETAKLFPDYVTVACQGTEGANSQIACDRIFRNSDIMFFSNFDAVFTSIEKGLCKYGVIRPPSSWTWLCAPGPRVRRNSRPAFLRCPLPAPDRLCSRRSERGWVPARG